MAFTRAIAAGPDTAASALAFRIAAAAPSITVTVTVTFTVTVTVTVPSVVVANPEAEVPENVVHGDRLVEDDLRHSLSV